MSQIFNLHDITITGNEAYFNEKVTFWKNTNFKQDALFEEDVVIEGNLDVNFLTTRISFDVGVGGTVITASGIGSVGINSTAPAYALDVIGDINSSTDIKVNGVSIVSSGGNASLDDVVALAIALG